MKETLFVAYNYYRKYFPIERGKYRIGAILHKLFGTFIVKSKLGYKLEVFALSLQDKMCIELDRDEDNVVYKEVANLKRGNMFVDIGANIGVFSILASDYVGVGGKIFSIEPSLREFKRLLTNLENNNCNNVCPINFALADKEGLIQFVIEKDHTGLNKIKSEESCFPSINVPVITFDKLFNSLIGHQKIDLVKIDVEGAELLILFGMKYYLSQKLIDTLIVEITPRYLEGYHHTKQELYEYLKSFGYYPKLRSEDWQYDEVFHLS